MKKNLMNLSLVGGMLAASVGAHAESLRIRVPFAFTASGAKLPAGEYSITEMAGNSTVLLINGSGARAMVFARMKASGRGAAGLPVIFEDEGSEGMALVGVRMADASFELSSPAVHANLAKTASLAIK